MTLLLYCRILVLATASHGGRFGNAYAASACRRQPYVCGTVNITYPFYLSSGDTESYCGYPGLAVRCDGGTRAVLRLGTGTYTVSRIDYDNLTVSLADADADTVGSCPTVSHNVTIPTDIRLFLRDSAVDYLLFFLDCSFGGPKPTGDDAPKPPKPPSFKPITTCGGEKGAAASFAIPRADVPSGDWSRACRAVFEVPVLRDAVPSNARNDPAWRNGGYAAAIRAGFQVGWERSSGRCVQCEQGNGKCVYGRGGESLSCLCANDSCGTAPSSGHKMGTKIYIIVSTSCFLLLCLLVLAFFLAWKYGLLPIKSKEEPRIESFLQKYGNLHPKRYTYAEVKRMTKSFSIKLGQGGFGAVYRGDIRDGREVAVKLLKDNKGDGEEFMNEVASISRTSHVNVVTLLGFCLEGSKRALIYEYMPKGSLERYAFNRNFDSENTLTWEKLFEIAIGIARGLEYLHRGCSTRIVHFDIKPHNILLDQDFCPKISDFGLAKLCLNKESAISIGSGRGTIGYIAPEVYSKQFGTVSSKSDVHSYGMMVLEMVGVRDTNNNANSESSSQYFPQWIYKHLDDYCLSASEINGETTELVRKLIVVGLWCIQLNPTHRPTMTRVVEMLEGSTSTLEVPPNMFL
ncbi:hypothetical protein QOZ80_1AG0029230 [Eleusine coracana subsp. coracana]|nr:hypothetical protein QOZ80_1AG0029230 [Eleusine coracana subsp. coracana]